MQYFDEKKMQDNQIVTHKDNNKFNNNITNFEYVILDEYEISEYEISE